MKAGPSQGGALGVLLCLATRAGLWILSHRTDVGSTCIDIRNASCMLLIAFSYLVHSVDLLVSSFLYYLKTWGSSVLSTKVVSFRIGLKCYQSPVWTMHYCLHERMHSWVIKRSTPLRLKSIITHKMKNAQHLFRCWADVVSIEAYTLGWPVVGIFCAGCAGVSS